MTSSRPEPPLPARLARKVLAQMGENGTPPEQGISFINAGNQSYLEIIDRVYVQELLRDGGSTFKLVQGPTGRARRTSSTACGTWPGAATCSPRSSPSRRARRR
ncbi:MAG TPA: hypothetical protein VFU21_26530 [Kofleriaceae bacterium]|nr:hypothetical protein [Kofleriaceae bacterium]